MRRNRVVWLLAFAIVILVVAGALAAVRRGFSAGDQPSALETYVARTARKLAIPSKARSEKNPASTSVIRSGPFTSFRKSGSFGRWCCWTGV